MTGEVGGGATVVTGSSAGDDSAGLGQGSSTDDVTDEVVGGATVVAGRSVGDDSVGLWPGSSSSACSCLGSEFPSGGRRVVIE